ncbi:MAG TPA: NAD-binding protein [Thermoflexales bacterium]|nr:NAD-binding protein [Thermoflexales bacterium]
MEQTRKAQATWRLVRAAVSRLRWPLAVFIILLAGGTIVFFVGGGQPNPTRALIYTLNLMTFQLQPGDVPDSLALQFISFGVIVGGVFALAGGAAKVVDYMTDEQERQIALASTHKDHIIVVGVGNVGYRVVMELLGFSERVVVINTENDGDWVSELQSLGVPVIIGDARKRDTLLKAGLSRAKSLVCCTSNELTNLDIALDARDMRPDLKVVLRMFDQALAQKVSKGFNIKTAFSVSGLAAPAFAVAATRTNVDYSFRMHGALMNVSTITVSQNSSLRGKTLGWAQEQFNVTTLSLMDGSQPIMHPSPAHALQSGDVCVFIGELAAIKSLNAAA